MQRQPQQQDENPLGMLQQLGLLQDPLQQLGGLVNLINASQAPQIQQDQFGQEMAYRQQQGDRQFGLQQDQFDMQGQRYEQQQGNEDRSFGLQQQGMQQQKDYQNAMLGNRNSALAQSAQQRQQQNSYEFMRMVMAGLMDPNGPGMMDPNVGAQVVSQGGFPGLFQPQPQQQAPYNTTTTNPELGEDLFRQSYKQHTGR